MEHGGFGARSKPLAPGAMLGPVVRSAVALTISALLLDTIRGQDQVFVWGSTSFRTAEVRGHVAQVASNARHTAALLDDGSVLCWGNNYSRQCLGPDHPAASDYVKVCASSEFTAALRENGQVDAWGAIQATQEFVPPLPVGTTYVDFALVPYFVGLRSDGVIVPDGVFWEPVDGASVVRIGGGWGTAALVLDDGSIVVGGDTSNGKAFVPALPPGVTYVEVDSGQTFMGALRSDGNIVTWGKCPDTSCFVPWLPEGVTYTELDIGYRHVLALRSDGNIAAWGDHYEGKCDVPNLPDGVQYTRIAAGQDHSVGYRSDGEVVLWGGNDYNQLLLPQAPPGHYFRSASAGVDFFVAVRSDGVLEAWGLNSHGQVDVPDSSPCFLEAKGLSAGERHALAIRDDGSVLAWGDNTFGQCDSPQPPAGLTYVQVSAGSTHSLALRSDGAIVAWGEAALCSPPSIPAWLSVVSVSAGGQHSVALLSDGKGVAWGDKPESNQYGQCDIPDVGSSWPSDDYLVSLEAGESHSVGFTANGLVVQVGKCPYAYCGDYYHYDEPDVSTTATSAGAKHTAFVRDNDSIPSIGGYVEGLSMAPFVPQGYELVHMDAGWSHNVAVLRPTSCKSATSYCSPGVPNSAYPDGAALTVAGCTSYTQNNLVLNVHDLPANSLGIFFYAASQDAKPVGGGTLCLSGPLARVYPAQLSLPPGIVSLAVDMSQPPFSSPAFAFVPGATWHLQYWYRDPLGPPSYFNFSDAITLDITP